MGFFGSFCNNMFLVRFQNMFKKEMSLNQIAVMTAERSSKTKKSEVTTISVIPVEMVDFRRYYIRRYTFWLHKKCLLLKILCTLTCLYEETFLQPL